MSRRAKRANRPNPRVDRQPKESIVIDINQYRKPKKKKIDIIPRNINQETYLEELDNMEKSIVFAVGPAGTGKTMLAAQWAIKMLWEGKYDKIVITRPNVAVDDKDIGFLPGDIFKKMTPWMLPLLDIFKEYYSLKEIEYLLTEEILEICPIAYIRARTFKNSIVIVDEAQGTSANSMLSILTRIGENSKMVITGDMKQADKGSSNGLQDFMDRTQGISSTLQNISIVKFTNKDIERHKAVKEILSIYGQTN